MITELQELGKPFAVLLNCMDPHTAEAKAMAKQLSEKYSAPVLPVSCPDLDETDICNILTELLRVFPVREINVCMPKWIATLEKDHWLRESVFSCIRQAASEIRTIRDTSLFADAVSTCPYVTRAGIREINMGTGSVCAEVELDSSLFLPHPGRNYRTGDPRRKRSAAYPAGTEPHSERIRQNRTGTAGSGGYRLWHRNARPGGNDAGRAGDHQTGRQIRGTSTGHLHHLST